MKIIDPSPKKSGTYGAIWTADVLPAGCYLVSDACDTSAMQIHAGFVVLTIDDNVVTAITGDDAAYHDWLDSLPEPTPPEPDESDITLDLLSDHEYRLCALELGM